MRAALILLLLLMLPIAGHGQPRPKETLVQKLLRIAGLTAAPSQMRAPGDPQPGDVWVVSIQDRRPRALTTDGGYRSPIFAPGGAFVYALRSEWVVRIAVAGGAAIPQGRAPNVVKLVGFDGDDLIVLTDASPPASPLALLSIETGRLASLPHDPGSSEELRLIAFVRGDERVYGETRVYTRTESRRGALRTMEWTDVYVARGASAPVNVSACGGVDCSAPALSSDGQYVAYVKAP